jgi:hypothetical protein
MTSSKPRLAISFSGGRTSAVMTKLCVDKFSETHDIAITFANTGCEHDNTLKFVDQCDKHFGWGVVWVEATVNSEKGKGIRHKVVDYESASREGEPFEAYIAKYGLCGPTHPQCTSRLKEEVMYDHRRSMGWKKGTYWTAIGIRGDEMDRISENRIERKFVYPLADAGWTKEDVKQECASWPFDLELKGEHYGNCTWCWKKSMRKLLTIAKEDPSVFDFPLRMEKKYQVIRESDKDRDGKHKIFRKHTSTQDLLDMAQKLDFEPYRDIDQTQMFSQANYDVFLDTGSACGESCEIGADE